MIYSTCFVHHRNVKDENSLFSLTGRVAVIDLLNLSCVSVARYAPTVEEHVRVRGPGVCNYPILCVCEGVCVMVGGRGEGEKVKMVGQLFSCTLVQVHCHMGLYRYCEHTLSLLNTIIIL